MILLMGIFFGWFYAVGSNLHKKLPETVNMNLTRRTGAYVVKRTSASHHASHGTGDVYTQVNDKPVLWNG